VALCGRRGTYLNIVSLLRICPYPRIYGTTALLLPTYELYDAHEYELGTPGPSLHFTGDDGWLFNIDLAPYVPPVLPPSIYFVNASGLNISPFDTAEKGATNFHSLFSAITAVDGDIIEVVSGDVIDDSLESIAVVVNKSITIRSWVENANKPVVKCFAGASNPIQDGLFAFSTYFDDEPVGWSGTIKITNIVMFKEITVDTPAGYSFFVLYYDTSDYPPDFEITGCEFYADGDLSALSVQLFDILLIVGTASPHFLITNNIFRTALGGIYAQTDVVLDLFVINNSFSNMLMVAIAVTAVSSSSLILNNVATKSLEGPQYPAIYSSYSEPGHTVDYNNIFGFVTSYYNVTPGPNNISFDPLFVSIDDVHIVSDSPCVNAGIGSDIYPDVPVIDYEGTSRPSDIVDIGAFEFEQITGINLFVVQRTNRHVVKRFDSTNYPIVYNGAYFGEFEPGSTDTALNFPMSLTIDSSQNIYVCDTLNSRILKLNFDLQLINKYSTIDTIGKPYAIMIRNNFIYVVGIYNDLHLRIEKLNNNLVSLISSTNLNDSVIGKQLSICAGFSADTIFIIGASVDIYETTETVNFSPVIIRQITGETRKIYTGAETSSGCLYLNDGTKIIKVNSLFENIGNSNKISKTARCLRQDTRGNLLIYNVDRQSILSYDVNLNFVAELFVNSGPFIGNDVYEIMDVVEANL
jgi:hypothetical protein